MRENKHLGAYGLVIKDEKILLIKKVTGPYDGKLDLPGGTIEFCERPEETLKIELLEETGINVTKYELFDSDSVSVEWIYNGTPIMTHHVGIFYRVTKYENDIKKEVYIDKINDDSLGADFYEIKSLSKNELSLIAILELQKLGYDI